MKLEDKIQFIKGSVGTPHYNRFLQLAADEHREYFRKRYGKVNGSKFYLDSLKNYMLMRIDYFYVVVQNR